MKFITKQEKVLKHLENAFSEIRQARFEIRQARFDCAGLGAIQQMIKDKITAIKQEPDAKT